MGDFQAELDSIKSAANGMTNGAIATATQLKQTLQSLASGTNPGDWSDVPSCRAFGASYLGAIKAYEKAAEDMLNDAKDMQQTLLKIHQDYADADDRRRADFDARMAALGSENYMTEQDNEKKGYNANRGVLHSDNPEAAPDQPSDAATDGNSTTTTTGPGSGAANNRVR